MKHYLLFAYFLFVLTTNNYCQTFNSIDTNAKLTNKDLSNQLKQDTVPTIEIKRTKKKSLTPIYYVNGVRRASTFLITLNPKLIDSINVVKNQKENGDINHSGEIHIKMKKEYRPNLISLNELRLKYAKDEKKPTVFMLDNEIIKEKYGEYIVDEKYILKIIIDNIEDEQQNIDIQFIRLLTRKDENIKQANEIRIRGNESGN